MSPNPFRFPLSFSLLVGIEVWDRSNICDPATLDVAIDLIVCDAPVDAYSTLDARDAHTNKCFAAAVGLVLAGTVTL